MTISRSARLSACVLVASSLPLCAQQGCFHSPEAPTSVLMLVGTAGMVYGSSFLRKAITRLRQK